MKELSQEQRVAALRRMADDGVDVLVVGGGITGAGVALDAAARGFRVGLLEKSDFASGTSSKSTKLVHGGIRYLPQFDISLVHEGLVERGLLLRNAPFLIQPIGFVLPLYADAKRPLGTPVVPPFGKGMGYLLRSGLTVYDLLAGRLGMGHHRHLGARQAAQLVPCLKTAGLVDAFLYYDAQTDDARLTTTVIRTAAQHGALVANYAEVMGFDRDVGQITAARVQDHCGGEALTIKVGTVVNAGGVFAKRIESLAGGESPIRLEPAKGVHLTVAREALEIGRDAIVLPETEDGRLMFVLPWGPRVIIGTTDTVGGDIDHPMADAGDVAYLLRHVNRYLRYPLNEEEIISTWAGYRPLLTSSRDDVSSARLSRTHAVIDSPGGMVTIVGGKLTTYRRMAQDTMDQVCRRRGVPLSHVTEHLPLDGTDGWREALTLLQGLASRLDLGADTVRHLRAYGAGGQAILDLILENNALGRRIISDLPYILAEVVYACRYEMAVTLDDVLERRLHLSIEERAHGCNAAPAVAELMAAELGWDATEKERQIARYHALVAAVDRGGGP